MYYNVTTMTVMVILNSCSLKEKQDDRYDQKLVWIRQRAMRRRYVQQARAHTTFRISIWNLSEYVSVVA
jgi:hypothetical protein